ncbi:unnamed protein product [Rotaria sp. Silwood2]|nr:unnamed protein product [Rotaria sp. Silwood2]
MCIDYIKDFQEDIPTINQHEVLIKIHAVSLNYRDLLIINNKYPFSLKDNIVPYSDGAGEIVEVGDQVIGFKKGDRVISNFDPTHLYGPSQSCLIKIPDHLSYEQAASLVCTGTTTWNALHGNNRLLPGQTVLLQGTGGVSLTGLMLAKAGGCTTIITSSDDEKLKQVKDKYGADYTINYKKQPNWDEEVLKITNGEGVDIILENGAALKPENPDVALLALGKSCIVRGIIIGSREQTEQLMNLVDQKKLEPPVHKVFNFDPTSVKEAYRYLESQTHMGKICIKVD